jgi:hypothetical protein
MRKCQMVALVVMMSVGGVVQAQDAIPSAAPLKEPPCKAVALSAQEEVLRLSDQNAELQKYIVRLQRALLEQAKQAAEPEIVKEAGGQPGQSWDYNTNALRPVTPAQTPPTSSSAPKPKP